MLRCASLAERLKALERTLLTLTYNCRNPNFFFYKNPIFVISSGGGRLESALGAVFSSF